MGFTSNPSTPETVAVAGPTLKSLWNVLTARRKSLPDVQDALYTQTDERTTDATVASVSHTRRRRLKLQSAHDHRVAAATFLR